MALDQLNGSMCKFKNPDLHGVLQHVPKINGELPSEDEQISDHERLFQRYFIDMMSNTS